MAAKLDQFTDEELLTLCALADAIYSCGGTMTRVERAFLAIMKRKQLWTPKEA